MNITHYLQQIQDFHSQILYHIVHFFTVILTWITRKGNLRPSIHKTEHTLQANHGPPFGNDRHERMMSMNDFSQILHEHNITKEQLSVSQTSP